GHWAPSPLFCPLAPLAGTGWSGHRGPFPTAHCPPTGQDRLGHPGKLSPTPSACKPLENKKIPHLAKGVTWSHTPPGSQVTQVQTAGPTCHHTLQWALGCEQEPGGVVRGWYQFGYDGQDLVMFDRGNRRWLAALSWAEATRRRWDAQPEFGERLHHYLGDTCLEWLAQFLHSRRAWARRAGEGRGASPQRKGAWAGVTPWNGARGAVTPWNGAWAGVTPWNGVWGGE
uniref:MHC class I-like antigen recognition-like domain-containing protein n=1 Tax=Chrysemys picta bellii TaxID=8478 RepID=A0A8C3FRD2_CHRPI